MGDKLVRERRVSSWRRIAMAAWQRPNDPTCYGTLCVDAGPALDYLRKIRETTGVKATMTHLVGRAVALAMRDTPDINGRIVGNRLYMRRSVDIFYQVVADDGKELSGAKLERVDEKDVHEIARELQAKAERIRARRDPQFESSKRAVDRLPAFLLKPTLRFLSYLTNDRGWEIRSLRLPADQFGSAMVTSVGMFGIDVGYAPIFPLAGTPLLVLVGEVQDKPVAQDGQVVIRPLLNLNVSFDHRFIDGFHAALMSKILREWLEKPYEHFDALPASTASAAS